MRRNKIAYYWLRGRVYKLVFGGPRTEWSAPDQIPELKLTLVGDWKVKYEADILLTKCQLHTLLYKQPKCRLHSFLYKQPKKKASNWKKTGYFQTTAPHDGQNIVM